VSSADPRDRRIAERVKSAKRRILIGTARCFKACFLGEDGKVSYEGERAIADLRKFARMGHGPDDHAFLRDLEGRIDPISMARIEGRRETVNRLVRFLELDPAAVQQFVEVDNES